MRLSQKNEQYTKIITSLLILNASLIYCTSSDIVYLSDYSQSFSSQTIPTYSDNYQTIPFSQVYDVDSFTVRGFLSTQDYANVGYYSNIFQIYKTSDPYTKIIKVIYDKASSTILVGQQISNNPFTEIISCVGDITNSNLQMIISLQNIGSQTNVYFKIIYADGTFCSDKKVINSAVTWNKSDFTVQLSNQVPYVASLPENPLGGNISNVFLVKNTYLGNINQVYEQFILRLQMHSQEGLLYIGDYTPPLSQQQMCIPDESNKKEGCADSLNPPSIYQGEAKFIKGQYFNFLNYKLFDFYDHSYNYSLKIQNFITFSFWFYLDDNNSSGSVNIFQWFWNESDEFLKVYWIQDSSGYKIGFKYIKNSSNNLITAVNFSLKKHYFIVFSIYQYTKLSIQAIIIDDSQILTEQFDNLTITEFNDPAKLIVGDQSSNLNSFYKISQFKVNLSSSILYGSSIVDTVIQNCLIAIFIGKKYQCLACKQNTFLFKNQCLNTCSTQPYKQQTQLRSCIRYCSNKCKNCDELTPNTCSACSSIDRDTSDKCNCIQGFEDNVNEQCLNYRALKQQSEIILLQLVSNSFFISSKNGFKNQYNSPPVVILSICSHENLTQNMKGIQTEIISITNQDIQFQYKSTTIGNFKLFLIVLNSGPGKFISKTLTINTPGAGKYENDIDVTFYDFTKYGDYQIQVFLSGIFFGYEPNQGSIRSSFKIEVNLITPSIAVTVNSNVSMIQVTYLVFPKNMPSLKVSKEFNLIAAPNFYQNTGTKYTYGRTHRISTNISSLGAFMLQEDSLQFPIAFGIVGFDIDLTYTTVFNFHFIPRSEPQTLEARLSYQSFSIQEYSGNGFYLVDIYNKDTDPCKIRDFYSNQCYQCFVKYSLPKEQCLKCDGNRIFSKGNYECICPDKKFDKVYTDEANCSFEEIAVLNIELSTSFDLITIDFGLEIDLTQLYSESNTSYKLCEYIFDQKTLDLLMPSSKCQLQGQIITILLDYDSTIKKENLMNFNKDKLQFIGSSKKITNFYRNDVKQNNISYSIDVDILYLPIVNICDPISLQIIQFLNVQKRGVKSFVWSLEQIIPDNTQIKQQIQQIIDNANSNKIQSIFIPKGILLLDMKVFIKLSYIANIDLINNVKLLEFQVKQIPILKVKSNTLSNPPFYRKDQIQIFYEISYSQCSQNGDSDQIQPASFDITIQEPKLQINKILFNQVVKSFSLTIDSYKTNPDILYNIQVSVKAVQNPQIVKQAIHNIAISGIPLLVNIYGGSRMHDYNEELILEGILKDLDIDQSLNTSPQIKIEWQCQNLDTLKSCRDIENQLIVVPQDSEKISFAPLTFIPYTAVQFSLKGEKDLRQKTSFVTVQFTDSAIPHLKVKLTDDVLLTSTINMNQIIEATFDYNQNENVNSLYFGGAIIYKRKVVSTMKFEYGKVRFQLWDYFTQFQLKQTKFLIRFTVYNPKYSMPSQSTFTFDINFPPQNCEFVVEPSSGFSLQTLFTFTVQKCQDPDQPIQYKFFYYTSKDLMQLEIKTPLLIQRRQLSDLSYQSIIQSYLPPGELLLLVQIVDSKNAIANFTKPITVTQQLYNEAGYIKVVNNIINFTQKQVKPMSILLLSILSEDIINRQQFANAIQNQIKQIISELHSLTNSEYSASTFQNLATQSISAILKQVKDYQNQNNFVDQINYIQGIIDKAEGEFTNADQFTKDKNNQQLYNSFSLIDIISDKSKLDSQSKNLVIKQSEKIGELLNVDALPNESAKVLNGENVDIVSQIVTSKKLSFYLRQETSNESWESYLNVQPNKNENINQVYDVTFKQYHNNLYNEEDSFKSLITQFKEQKPSLLVQDYKAINPEITLHQTKTPYQLENNIKYSFTPKSNEVLTCISKVKSQWTSQGCKSVYNEKTKDYNCICDNLNPVTVINDISDLFDSNQNVETIFSGDGIDNILNFDNFYKYAAFWVLLSITLSYLILALFGIYIDKLNTVSTFSSPKTQISPIQLPQYPTELQQDFSLELDQNKLTQSPQLDKNVVTITTIGDIAKHKSKSKQLLQNSVEKIMNKKLMLIQNNTENKPKEISLRRDSNLDTIKEEIEKNQKNNENHLEQQEPEKLKDHGDDSSNKLSIQQNEESPNKITHNPEKVSILKSKSLIKQMIYFHDLIQIFLLTDPILSRFTRFTFMYIKNLHLFTSTIVFNRQLTITQIIFLQIFNQIIVVILNKFIELGFSRNNLLRRVFQFLAVILICLYYYAFLAVVSDNDPSSTNIISVQFYLILLIDSFITCTLVAIIFRMIAFKLISQTQLTPFQQKLNVLIKLPLILTNQ